MIINPETNQSNDVSSIGMHENRPGHQGMAARGELSRGPENNKNRVSSWILIVFKIPEILQILSLMLTNILDLIVINKVSFLLKQFAYCSHCKTSHNGMISKTGKKRTNSDN